MAPAVRKKVIGLVGGIGSGKSLAARQFASLGCAIINADELAHEALNEPGIKQTLLAWWGPGVLASDGSVDRRAVGEKVFADAAELEKLEELLHPRINRRRAQLREKFQADPNVVAIVDDTPLLLEKQLDRECDVIVFVAASREERLKRVAASRGWSAEELDRRQKNQLPLDIKAKRADYVLENNAGEVDCLSHVRRVLSQILSENGR